MNRDYEWGIVPTDTIETSQLFSDTQKKVLVRRTLTYLQEEGVSTSPSSLRFASAVVLDSLKRGLEKENKTLPGKNESLGKYLKVGFEQRRSVFLEARQNSSEVKHQQPQLTLVGAYALLGEFVKEVDSDILNFSQLADISKLDEFNATIKHRKAYLDGFLTVAISGLPEVLQDNARRQNFSDSQKSRLVRNMLLSIGLRGNSSPIISLDDLSQFSTFIKEDPKKVFGNDRFEDARLFLENNGLELDDRQLDFMRDLWNQLDESFEHNQLINPTSKDIIYQKYSPTLLLLHPALEEIPIVTDKGRIESGVNSLWNAGNSTAILGYLIPNKEILIAARVQADARGYLENSKKMRDAIQLWNRYYREKLAIPGKLLNMEELLASGRIRGLDLKKNYTEGFEPRSLEQLKSLIKQISGRLIPVKKRLGTDRRLIEGSRENRVQAVEYYERLLQQPEKSLEISKEHYLRSLSRELGGFSSSITALEGRIEQKRGLIEGIVSGELSQVVRESIYDQIRKSNSDPEILVKQMEYLLRLLKNDPATNIFRLDSNPRVLKTLVMAEESIAGWDRSRRRELGFYGQGQLSAKMRRDEFKRKNFNDPVVLNMVSISIINRLINLNKMVLAAQVKRDEAEEKQRKLGSLRRELRENPETPLPSDALKDLDTTKVMMIRAKLASVPENLSTEQLEKTAELTNINLDSIRRIFPRVVSRDGFKEALDLHIPNLEQEVADSLSNLHGLVVSKDDGLIKIGNRRREIALYNLSKTRLESARIFSRFLSDPMLDLELAEGISKSMYIDSLKLRIYKLRRLMERPSLTLKLESLMPQLQALNSELEFRVALNRVISLEHQIDSLKNEQRPEMRMVQRMNNLGLAIKLEPEVN